METLEFYTKLASKILKSKMLNKSMREDDEVLGEITKAIMIADTKYNPEIGCLDGFRAMYADYALKTLRSKWKERNKLQSSSISDYESELVDNKSTKKGNSSIFWDHIKTFKLTNAEKIVIYMYYWKSNKFKQIANFMKISTPRVIKIHQKALDKLHDYLVKESI